MVGVIIKKNFHTQLDVDRYIEKREYKNDIRESWIPSDHPDFKLGSKEFWEISAQMGSDDEDDEYDPSKAKKRNAGQQISVKKNKW